MHKQDDRIWEPVIIGHRGASAHAPENTAPAFALALAAGAQGLELDLQISRDAHIVVFHDHKMSKLGLRSQHIRDYDWPHLATRDAGVWFAPEFVDTPLLRLQDVLLRWGKQTHLLLEIKAHGRNRRGSRDKECAQIAAEQVLVAAAQVRENVRFLSFSDAVLQAVAAVFAARALAPPFLVRNIASPGALKRTTREELQRNAAICVNIDAFSTHDVTRVHRLEKPLYAYTVDSELQIRHAHALGCQLLICNDPGRVRERLLEYKLPALSV